MNWLAIKIALRYLRSKKAHSAVNIISSISVAGVMVATAALICVLSVFNGFRMLIEQRVDRFDPEIAITATSGKTIENLDSVLSVVDSLPCVALAVPTICDQALAIFSDFQMPILLKGVPDNYDQITDIRSTIIDGRYELSDGISSYAVMGIGPAITLNVRPDYPIMTRLYAPRRRGSINLANPATAFRQDSMFVSGIFQSEQSEVDRNTVFVSFETAEYLFDYDNEASAIEVVLSPEVSAASGVGLISNALGPRYLVRDRFMQQAETFRMVNMEKWMSFLLLAFILIIATFNIIGALSLLIIEKDSSITTLRHLGAPDSLISSIFVAEGWIISLLGAFSGIALGIVLCLIQQHFGIIKLSGNTAVMLVNAYPVAVSPLDVIISLFLVAIISLFTSIITSLTMRARLKA